ncbi:hypothetical protein I0P70_00440 [Pontibacter sp. FD36]|uniref:hypothetical protein n=1 Tax=Pontibacter sp. FD36 TaxID=2789860 RepID=UPI0018A8C2C0|nr:hypothetical protein [Pontibacter sp. FD36]MBF8961695.1 hypothetical protein [Pontibacter sp. FD36]
MFSWLATCRTWYSGFNLSLLQHTTIARGMENTVTLLDMEPLHPRITVTGVHTKAVSILLRQRKTLAVA